MLFNRFNPDPDLERIVECYWAVEDPNPVPRRVKIIPDGFTEIIVHFAHPYRIGVEGTWQLQSKNLLAGQISRHFFLENTGPSDIIGIKLKPTALTRLFNLSMIDFTDKVVDANSALGDDFREMDAQLRAIPHREGRIILLNAYFRKALGRNEAEESPADRAVKQLMDHHGMIPLAEVKNTAGVGERQLENLFRKHVGLSPKLFARILRFSYIFQRVEEDDRRWTALAYETSFYDQSHFIRNFRNFTGESPGKYAFDEKNMANFFLKKK